MGNPEHSIMELAASRKEQAAGAVRSWRTSGWMRVLIGLLPLLVLLPHVLGVVHYDSVTRLEQRTYDLMLLQRRPPATLDERIVIVDIDEASLQRYGRWPWQRNVLAQLGAELLNRQNVAVLGYDVLFAEPERDDTLQMVSDWLKINGKKGAIPSERLNELAHALDRDAELVRALEGKPAVLGYYYSQQRLLYQIGSLTPPLLLERPSSDPLVFPTVPRMTGYAGNLVQLVHAVQHGGFINAEPDTDGVLRSVPLVVRRSEEDGTLYYPALSLDMLMLAMGVTHARLVPVPQVRVDSEPLLAGIALQQQERNLLLPTSVNGNFLIPYREGSGRPGTRYHYIPAYQVLNGSLPEGSLSGKLVLVGTSVPGLRDLRATPVSTTFPGVEVHATMLSAMLDGDFLQVPDYSRGYAALALLIATGVLLGVTARVGMVGSLLWSLGLAGLFVLFHVQLFNHAGLVLPLASTLLTIVLSYVLLTSFGYFVERRTKRELVKLFGHYVPSELVARMAREPEQYSTQASSRELTVMFCDLQGFTTLSESMDPEELQAFLNNIFNRMARVIAPNHGTIDKYMGDCVMVFWGAPLADEDHAWHAVKTALDLRGMLRVFNQEQMARGAEPMELAIGLNSGLMSVGDMGSDMRRSYTVIGDAVNLAARLEPLARVYGVPAVVGERTVQLVSQCHWQWLDRVRVSGKARPVDIYAPFTPDATLDTAQQRELGLWHRFREAYRRHDWNQCATLLAQLQALAPACRLYALYHERLQEFLRNPPPRSWDGVTDQLLKKSASVKYSANDGA